MQTASRVFEWLFGGVAAVCEAVPATAGRLYVCVCVRKIPTNKWCLIVLAMLQTVRLVEQLSQTIRSRGWGHVFPLVMGKVDQTTIRLRQFRNRLRWHYPEPLWNQLRTLGIARS